MPDRLRILFAWLTLVGCVLAVLRAEAKPGRGWTNPHALDLAKEASDAKKAGDAPLCVARDKESLALEEHPYVRLHLSSCLAPLGRLKDALANARDALAAAIRDEDPELLRAAQQRVAELLPRLAHLRIHVVRSSERIGLKVTVNGVPVPGRLLEQRITMDPGDFNVEAERDWGGKRYEFKKKGTLAEGEEGSIDIVLVQADACIEECLRSATNDEERRSCIETCFGKPPDAKPAVRIGLDMSGYTDSTNVHVLTPGLNGAVSNPVAGWSIGGSYILDVVTAASPDIVSMASNRFRESRHAGTLSGGYRLGPIDTNAIGHVSREPDYLSSGGGIALSTDLGEKHYTPRVGYDLSYDKIGIRSSPFANYERNLTTHSIDAGLTIVMSPTTLLVLGSTVQIELGEQSKLYRFVPMFRPEDVPLVSPGEPYETVNAARLPIRPREQLPRDRERIALGARLNHRFSSATLRLEERAYVDTWGILATTTDARCFVDLGEHLRVWPHVRLHAQKGATFYRLAYAVEVDNFVRATSIPVYRTGDRELSPMVQVTAGAGARIALTSEKASTRYAVIVSGDVMYGYYFASLFIRSRTAVYGTIGFEVEM